MFFAFLLKYRNKIIITLSVLLFLFLILFIYLLSAPGGFPVATIYNIQDGAGLSSLSLDLKSANIIRSPFLFKVFSVIFGGSRGIMAGDYNLEKRQNTISLAYRISKADYRLEPVRLTIPEGYTAIEISELITKSFSLEQAKSFLDLAVPLEGYLFPDTYFFLPKTPANEMVDTMKKTFDERIKTLETDINNFGKSLADIIKMASIVEEEARSQESRQIVAGILWRRLSLNMPLQVDASFKYINGKTTKDLTLIDLKINSPYNSYLYKGLPPTPITNPGLESIRATITPIKTDYLYFLSDNKGNMHYTRSYDEHLQNKKIYLK